MEAAPKSWKLHISRGFYTRLHSARLTRTVNPEYFVRTQFSYPGLSDLSYAWNFRTVADCCGFSDLRCTFRMHFIFVQKPPRTKYTKNNIRTKYSGFTVISVNSCKLLVQNQITLTHILYGLTHILHGAFCILLWNFHRRCVSAFSISWCKKVKNGQKLQIKGSCLNLFAPQGRGSKDASFWNCTKKIQRKSWSNAPPKLLACIGFLYKVVDKNDRLRKFNRACKIELNFLTAYTISMKLGTLVHHVLGYATCLRFLICAKRLNYGLSKSKKKNGVKSSLNFEDHN